MSVIDFTQEEGYDPNLKTQFVHMTLETNSASCTGRLHEFVNTSSPFCFSCR